MKTGPGIDTATKTITLGVITPLSGPAALIGKPLTAGQQAYFASVDGTGGIDGWKVKLSILDDAYDPQKHVQDYNQLVPSVSFFAQSLGSPTTSAIESQATSAGVLLGTAAQSSAFVNHPSNLVIGSPYAVDSANAVYYITQKLGIKNPKMAIFYQNDAYGADGLKGYEAAKSAYHFQDVAHTTYNVTDTSFTSQATALKNSGAKYVLVTAIPTSAGTLIGTAAALGYHPQWILQGPAWSEYLMTSTGTASGKPTPIEQVLKGAWVLGFEAAWGDMSVPGMSQFLDVTKKYAPQQIPDGYYMYGYCMAEAETAVLRKAIAENNLTRAGILSAKQTLGTVDFGGLIPTATYTPANGPATRMTDIAGVDLGSPGFLKIIEPYFTSPVAANMTFSS
jgi:ABC-type branched-subunit amino acid transport system substrate-binding protein